MWGSVPCCGPHADTCSPRCQRRNSHACVENRNFFTLHEPSLRAMVHLGPSQQPEAAAAGSGLAQDGGRHELLKSGFDDLGFHA